MDKEVEKEYTQLELDQNRINKKIDRIDEKIDLFNKVGWGFIFLGIIIAFSGLVIILNQSEIKLSEIGDFMGGTVATCWSLSGLFFIYVAFLGQQKQMLLQNLDIKFNRIELKLNRQELAGQKEQMRLQTQNLIKQNFEDTLFRMIALHKENLEGWQATHTKTEKGIKTVKKINGFRAMFPIYNDFKDSFKQLNKKGVIGEKNKIEMAFGNFVEDFKVKTGYFGHLSHIYNFIESSNVDDKKLYFKIISNQLALVEKVFFRCYLILLKESSTLKILHDNSNIQEVIEREFNNDF
ncbi:MAG: hypothetical protein AB8G86_00125 [Saprospiraceae bacterium]